MLQQWDENIGELFHNNTDEKPTINKSREGLVIRRSDVKSVKAKMKRSKTVEHDKIVKEILKASDSFEINMIDKLNILLYKEVGYYFFLKMH